MSRELYRYTFSEDLSIGEVEESLVLSIMAAESLHGESQVRLDAAHVFDAERRACVIDCGSDVGRDLNRLFIGFLRREFGESLFQVRRVHDECVAEVAA